jgi:hypothetical protein
MVKNQLDVLVRVHKVGIPTHCTQDSEGTFLIYMYMYCNKTSKVELETLPQESKRGVLEFGMKSQEASGVRTQDSLAPTPG